VKLLHIARRSVDKAAQAAFLVETARNGKKKQSTH